MTAWIAADAIIARYSAGAWHSGRLTATRLEIDGEQVVGAREAAIDEPGGGDVIDDEARTAIDAILSALRAHGLIDPS